MVTYTTTSERETEAVAKSLADKLRAGDVLAYEGGLGAGKTAFTRGLAAGLGITEPVSSPTFAIANAYQGGRLALIHFDMYRVESAESLEDTGYYDYISGGAPVIYAIEWSENIIEALPDDAIRVQISRVGDNTRTITISGGGDDRF